MRIHKYATRTYAYALKMYFRYASYVLPIWLKYMGSWVCNRVRVGKRVGSHSNWVGVKEVVGSLVMLASPQDIWRRPNLACRLARRCRTSGLLSVDRLGGERGAVAHPVAVPVFPGLPLFLEIRVNKEFPANNQFLLLFSF